MLYAEVKILQAGFKVELHNAHYYISPSAWNRRMQQLWDKALNPEIPDNEQKCLTFCKASYITLNLNIHFWAAFCLTETALNKSQ